MSTTTKASGKGKGKDAQEKRVQYDAQKATVKTVPVPATESGDGRKGVVKWQETIRPLRKVTNICFGLAEGSAVNKTAFESVQTQVRGLYESLGTTAKIPRRLNKRVQWVLSITFGKDGKAVKPPFAYDAPLHRAE
jgi:hypothetical protein